MKSIILLSFVCYVSCIDWKDCGPSDAIWRYTDVSLSPTPIIYPDPIDVKLAVKISADVPLDSLQLQISVNKLTPSPMHIPCLNGFGSCNFDYCDYEKSSEQSKDLFASLAQIKCQVKQRSYNFDLPGRTMPILGDAFKKVMEGGFEFNATYVDTASGKVYGCVNAKFDVHLKN